MIAGMSSSRNGDESGFMQPSRRGWEDLGSGLIMPVEIRRNVVGGDAKDPPGLERNMRVGDVVGHTAEMGIEVESRRGG
jgi:hypothetical protein